MRPIAGVQDDWASVIQAYVEITQTMTSAHDILVSTVAALPTVFELI